MARDAAKELFDQLNRAFVDEAVLGKEFEGSILEVKRGPADFADKIRETEKGQFAKALSGFANTSGGILVFGLGTSKNENIDVIDTLCSINNLKKFESALRQIETRCVERLVQGIEYKVIEYGSDRGILAIYIPPSQTPPHRSKCDNHFYIRGGDSFVPLDLTIIEDLMHRRARPNLIAHIEQERPNDFSSDFLFSLANDGESTARDPFIVIEFPENARDTRFELDGNNYLTSWVRTPSYNGRSGYFLTFRNGYVTPIHPKIRVPLLRIRGTHESGSYSRERTYSYNFKCWIAAESMPLKEQVCLIKSTEANPEPDSNMIKL